jgi:hypothetical protein
MLNKTLSINLGGVVVGFESAIPELGLYAIDSYRKFVSHEPPEITITVRNHGSSQLNLGTPRFGNNFWSFYETQQSNIIQMNTRSRGIFPRTDTLIFSPGGDLAELYVEQDLAAAYPTLPGLELPPFLLDEMMATSFISQRSGLHFHACGLNAWGGRGFLFAGYSGTGKSTLARIWRESGAAVLLSDERVAVRRLAGQYGLYGTPWHSEIEDSCSPERVPLERIFILEHAAQNRARRLRPAAAVAGLAARAFLPFWDPKGMERSLEFLDELTQAIPCYELGFVPDASVIDFIKCLND